MGAFIIGNVLFNSIKDRKKFERIFKEVWIESVLVDNDTEGGFAWRYLRDPIVEVVYYFGNIGYYDIRYIYRLSEYKGINIKRIEWIPINDGTTEWKIIKRYEVRKALKTKWVLDEVKEYFKEGKL